MGLKLYYELLSQPSRALFILLKINKIPFESVEVNLGQGEHLTDEFKKISKFQKVPFIRDGDFQLTESVAITRYLGRNFDINNWYPKDNIKQARIDEYLEWQHLNTRLHCAMYFQIKWLRPLMTGKPPKTEVLERYTKNMIKALDDVENLWLEDHKFICGDQISVADIFAACEIEQLRAAGFEPTDNRAKLGAWLNTVRTQLDPIYTEAHKKLNKIAERSLREENKKKSKL